MMSLKRIFFCCIVCLSCHVNAQQTAMEETPLIDFFELMKDAEDVGVQFKVQTQIESEYKIRSVQPYIFLEDSKTLTKLESIKNVQQNLLSMSFEHSPSTGNEYLILHVQYTPRFVHDGKSEGVCFAEFYAKRMFDSIRCDSQSTSLYLLASLVSTEIEDDPLFTPAIVERMIKITSLPDSQTWQNYQSLLTFLLNHVAEQPNYSTINLSNRYLLTFKKIVKQVNTLLLNDRSFDIAQLDEILRQQDVSMTNVGYRVYMTIDSFINRIEDSLPHVYTRPSFIKEFFAGITPFSISEPVSMKLASVELKQDSLHFIKWPWFDKVSVKFDKQEAFFTLEEEIPVGPEVTQLTLRPHGTRGRFSRTTLVVDKSDVEYTSNVKKASE